MSDNPIKVTVVKYSDRRFLMMRYIDPITDRQKARSTGTTVRREAERIAAKWEAELREGRYQATANIAWREFRERYEEEKLSGLSQNMADATATAFNHVERLINPQRLSALTTSVVSRLQAKFRQEGMKDTTMGTHLRHLKAALNWAVSMELLPKAPEFHMPRRAKGSTLMRGRPITTEEFERMLAVVNSLRPTDAGVWKHYLNGLWLSGLRLEESLILSWEEDTLFSIDLTGRRPRFRIFAEGEKGRRDRLLPLTPDFSEMLARTPQEERTGHVFKLRSLTTGQQLISHSVCRIVSKIGKQAGVVVNRAENKFASAHDLRRSFGTRWAGKVKPITLRLLMRHESVETTMKYYVSQDSDDVADELWAAYERDSEQAQQRTEQSTKK